MSTHLGLDVPIATSSLSISWACFSRFGRTNSDRERGKERERERESERERVCVCVRERETERERERVREFERESKSLRESHKECVRERKRVMGRARFIFVVLINVHSVQTNLIFQDFSRNPPPAKPTLQWGARGDHVRNLF